MRFFHNILTITAFVLFATLAHANTVPISWQPVQGANTYRVTVTANGSVVLDTYTTNTTKNLQGLQQGQVYRCTVAPIINGNQSADFIIVEDIMP